MEKIIYGTGMCARAVVEGIGTENVKIIQPVTYHCPESVELGDLNLTICSQTRGGLSSYYHGVTPCDTMSASKNQKYLKSLNLKVKPELFNSGYFVPRRVPRPKKLKNIQQDEVALHPYKTTYLCLSVIGNLSTLQQHGHIPNNVPISDDLQVAIGSFTELPQSFKPKQYIDGVMFPHLEVPFGIITFRPVYDNETQIDFSKNILKQVFKGKAIGIMSKVSQAIYLKYGLQPMYRRPLKWLALLQINISSVYNLHEGIILPNTKILSDLQKKIPEYLEILTREITTPKIEKPAFFNGIHLGYDREFLKNVPSNIYVFDTSLNDKPGTHPTIKTYCKIRELLDEK